MGLGRYGKIFEQFFDSTIVDQELSVRYAFMAMIVLSDENGIIDMTPEAIARRINLPVRQVKAALEVLEAPDPDSRNSESEGRRLVRVDDHRGWGWIVVSKEIFRDMKSPVEEREKARERKRRQRERERESRENPPSGHADVTAGHALSRHSDSDRDSDSDSDSDSDEKNRAVSEADFEAVYQGYPAEDSGKVKAKTALPRPGENGGGPRGDHARR
jgi:hypothetical protein